MDAGKLIKMANDIGRFFAAPAAPGPARDQALFGIADHIKRFWDPRMRSAMFAALDAGQAQALEEPVAAALQAHRTLLTPVIKG